jgi:hypothetical protein
MIGIQTWESYQTIVMHFMMSWGTGIIFMNHKGHMNKCCGEIYMLEKGVK